MIKKQVLYRRIGYLQLRVLKCTKREDRYDITFLSTPGQGFKEGMSFIQKNLGLHLPLIVDCLSKTEIKSCSTETAPCSAIFKPNSS